LKKISEDGMISQAHGLAEPMFENGYVMKSNLHVQCNPIKIPMTLMTEIEKSSQKFIWKHKGPQIPTSILSKRSNTGNITIPNFKLHYRAIAIKQHGTGTKTDRKTSGTE
jgi:hypothetical protein